MHKSPNKPIEIKVNTASDKLPLQRGKYDLQQFREGLKAELADKANKAITSCASADPNLLERVVQAHLAESPDQPIQRQQVDQADKHQHGNKRAITQAEATASVK